MNKNFYIILLVIFLIYIPYYFIKTISSSNNHYSKNSYFRNNIYNFRKTVEKFYSRNKKYPKNINELKLNALKNNYWEQPKDTFKNYYYDLINLKNIPLNNKEKYSEKLSNDSIGYKLLETDYHVKYVIYGINKDGSFIDNGLKDKEIFYLEGLLTSK